VRQLDLVEGRGAVLDLQVGLLDDCARDQVGAGAAAAFAFVL
jgi:hypothetical protein